MTPKSARNQKSKIKSRKSKIVLYLSPLFPLLTILLAFALRVWQLDTVPPGWRDDELIETLVISQKILDGDWAVYYPDASGHELFYHALNAAMLKLFGPTSIGIRYISAVLSLITIALTYTIGRHLFNSRVGLLAAAALTLSFWSLMYARVGIRHVAAPPFALLAFYFFWQGLRGDRGTERQGGIYQLLNYPLTNYFLAGLFTALGFYTYFAARGVPLILVAYCGYLVIFAWKKYKPHIGYWLVMFGVTAVLALPLIITLQQQPESEARIAELAFPLNEARAGNFQPILQHTIAAFGMFHTTGDSEWLYNIANRPIFGLLGAIFFWLGVITAIKLTLEKWQVASGNPSPHLFLLLWWLAGISPAFLSVPPASLSHTILAQPATFLLLALPLAKSEGTEKQRSKREKSPSPRRSSALLLPSLTSRLSPFASLLPFLLLVAIAGRDLPDYFVKWPERGLVRFLYRGDYADIADYLNDHPELTDFGITSLLAGPWDKMALDIDLNTAVRPRWYNPERTLLVQPPISFYSSLEMHDSFAEVYHPGDVRIGDFNLGTVQAILNIGEPVCFQNGLCVLTAVYSPNTQQLSLNWQLRRPLDLPPIPLISNPPPPGVYAGPRLSVFTQILSADGQYMTGDDGLWIDPTTLYEGDIFIQQHTLPAPTNGQKMVFGLYDPMTNERILTEDGRDAVAVEIGE